MEADKKTGWLWVFSFLAICAFPTSVLFISEFIMIKTMIIEKHYVLCALFVLLLTIVLWGMGKVVIKMAFNKLSEDKAQNVLENKKHKKGMLKVARKALSFGVNAVDKVGNQVALKSEELFRNKSLMKRQMMFYGVFHLYEDGLEQFMNL